MNEKVLQQMIADLDGYIERRAAELAAPLVEAAQVEARAAVAASEWADRRREDVTAECHRQIARLEELLDEHQEARGMRRDPEVAARREARRALLREAGEAMAARDRGLRQRSGRTGPGSRR